jgi:hypothetical protein
MIKRKIKVKNTGEFLKKRSVFGIIGGFWAMIPDIDHFLGNNFISSNPASDIFFLHISLDKVLPETDLFFAAEMLLIFAVINLLALVATVETFKRLNEVMFGKKPDEEDEGHDFLDDDRNEDKNEEDGEV